MAGPYTPMPNRARGNRTPRQGKPCATGGEAGPGGDRLVVTARPRTVPLETQQREAAVAALVELFAEALQRHTHQEGAARQRAA